MPCRNSLLLILTLYAAPVWSINADSMVVALGALNEDVRAKTMAQELHQARKADSATFFDLHTKLKSQLPASSATSAALIVGKSDWLFYHGKYEEALLNLQSRAALWQAEASWSKAQGHLIAGYICQEIGLLDKSLSHSLEALNVANTLADTSMILRALNYIGESYRHVGEYALAIEYFEMGIDITEISGEPSPRLLNNLGLALVKVDRFTDAKSALERGLDAARNQNDLLGEAKLLTNLGFIHKEVDQLNKALEYYLLSLNIKKQVNNPKSLAYTLNDIGEVLGMQGKYEEALAYSKHALALAQQEQVIYYLRDMNLTIAKIFEPMGEADSALKYFQRFHQLHDSIDNIASARNLARIEKLQELNAKEAENAALQAENLEINETLRSQNIVQILLILILLLMTAFGVMVYRAAQKRKELLLALEVKNNELRVNNAKLNRLLNEQESLFDIVAHDVKGPLSNMVTLLNLEQQESDAAVKGEMRRMIASSARGALQFIQDYDYLHRLEKSQQQPETEEFSLTQLIQNILSEFDPAIAKKRLNIHFDASKNFELNSVESFVRHILYNLLSNAIKFSPENGDIFINIIQTDRTRVSIEDRGPGIAEKYQDRVFERFFRGSSAEGLEGYKSSGLGLALVKLLIDKLNGEIKLKSTEGEGTEFIVYLG